MLPKKNMIEIYQAIYKISYIILLVLSASGDIIEYYSPFNICYCFRKEYRHEPNGTNIRTGWIWLYTWNNSNRGCLYDGEMCGLLTLRQKLGI